MRDGLVPHEIRGTGALLACGIRGGDIMTIHRSSKRPAPRAHRDGDADEAFVRDISARHHGLGDDVAESFAEEFIASVTSAASVSEDARDEWVADEMGGIYVEPADDELD
jgi:hypothetical protein